MKNAPLGGLTILFLLVMAALFAEFIAPHSPIDQDITQALKVPFFLKGGTLSHLLGTDELGRDILSRIIFGARISLVVGFIAVAISGFIGTCLGLISGYFGGKIDSIIMRVVDVQLSMPYILIALALIGALGPSLRNIIIVIGITSWVDYGRVIRGEVLSVKENEFVDLAKIAGCSTYRILLKHIFPSVVNSLIVLGTLMLGRIIIFEAALSFLGLGVQPPTPSWGIMLADGRQYLTYAWWLATFPGLAIMLVVLGTNLVGDWLRDMLDPRQRAVVRGKR
ncbi:MAG: ABC transporter permease [Deltaproteobacteria bacterium]|nr:ABC transporter permease [Deltaproteobacteria bacterium]OQY15791.1 MAG: peptide ABC transporter permease [Desulfobacterium sp. 4572_20]RLB38965.1 MAG: ABC transporter permease [Deltaproteobacteria bacterium]HDH88171.1 ABC transporter permease [Desulfobacteraceae bacterium]